MAAKSSLPLWTAHLLLALFATSWFLVDAVDQRKFRTCSQTSFCRRHRERHSAALYQYKLEESTVKFHLPSDYLKGDEQDSLTGGNKAAVDSQAGGSLWGSLQQRLLGGSDAKQKRSSDQPDPYVQGPPPTLTGRLVNEALETSTGKHEHLDMTVHAMADGVIRVRVHEIYQGTHHEHPPRVTYDELILTPERMKAAEHAQLIPVGDSALTPAVGAGNEGKFMGLKYGDKIGQADMFLVLQLQPFATFLYREDDIAAGPIVTMGEDQLTHFEIRRKKDASDESDSDDEADEEVEDAEPEKEIVGYWEDGLAIYADGTREERKDDETSQRQLTELELDREGLWEEKFGDHKDSKPHGPMSVGADIRFPKSSHVYGLPEHASSTKLKNTVGPDSDYSDPYRLYNLDVFEYDLDVPMALYGAIPLIISQSKELGTAGAFWLNPSETFVDIQDGSDGSSKTSHWMSETGIIDVFFVPGPTPSELYSQYAQLTGVTALPPMFSLGYHQCRWNYKDEQDVYQVHGKFEELDYPYDVLWLDIEHTDGKRYFTWDKNLFQHPEKMQEKLWSQGRRMVTIIDPHLKRDNNYHIHKEATAKGLYVKDKDGKNDFDGWCWPGSSSYLDFTSEKARRWWSDQFAYNKYKGSTPSLFTWNDMNEMSVFNGPEVTMQKDTQNLAGEEHREWHNIYGMLFQRATAEGQVRRNEGENLRPFVLSRAFFAGSQKYGAVWTGDNEAQWSHLVISVPMLLSLNVGALSFVGADVGGFFGNTDAELMTRWMQAGAYTPFFRGHAHHDAKRREPWMFGDETMVRLRNAAMSRYALLPYWYTLFAYAGDTGMPIMRTMWMEYPATESLFDVDDQFLVGSDILVKPVTAPGVTETTVKFPTDDIWYDAESLLVVAKSGTAGQVEEITVPSDIDTIPVFQKGGSVVPRKLRLRRSTHMMQHDPYTLYIALDQKSQASGSLYMDDEVSFDHMKVSAFASATFAADFSSSKSVIENTAFVGSGWKDIVDALSSSRRVERIIVMGVENAPSSVDVGSSTFGFTHDSERNVLVIRKPDVSALLDWKMIISF